MIAVIRVLLVASIVALVVGCEDGGDSSSAPANVAGTWNFYDHSVSDIIVGGTLSLTQSGNDVQGRYRGIDGFTGGVTGGVSGSRFDAVIMFDGYPSSTTLKATVSGETMSGSWSAATGESGKFHAVLVN